MGDRISIIVPIYKVEQYLDECVRSIVDQTYSDLEIILVDDGSPDRCPAMCDKWAKKDSRIKVIHKENGGLSDARNAGLEIASGEYIAFVDSDDWILPQMYEKMLEALQRENGDICACSICSCYENGRRVSWGCKEYFVGNSEQTLNMLYSDTAFPVSAWNKLFRRKCWETIHFPVGKICEDTFTTYLLVHQAERIIQIPEALYCYRIRPQSIMTASFTPRRMDEEEAWRVNYEFAEKHYPSIARKAFDFYLQKVNVLIQTIPADKRQVYAAEYTYLKSILNKNRGYILIRSGIPMKQRIRLLMDIQKL